MTNYPTSIGTSDETSIELLGHDLATDLLGKVGFTELTFLLVAQRRPTAGELRVFEAVLVALTDHGFTPSVIAARLTLTGAPESVQGALAAGLLGGGSRFLGTTENTGLLLATALAAHAPAELPTTTTGWDDLARDTLRTELQAGGRIPGLGHPVHKDGDPRTPVLIRIATEEGVLGPHLRLLQSIERVLPGVIGRELPINGAGVCGAVLCDLGFPVQILRGIALLARAAGLLGHLTEEMRQPVGMDIYRDVERAADYQPPTWSND